MKECKKCEKEMLFITEDEGGLAIYWCYNCGSLGTEGEDVEFYPVGIKPVGFDYDGEF